MMRVLVALGCGAVFGAGMIVSGMANPVRVLGFFDLGRGWDPTLGFVMLGALAPMAVAWRVRARMARSVLGDELPAPASRVIDARLLGGAAVFGLGWGIVGLCPGAVVPALAVGGWPVAVFALAMLGGMAATRAVERAGLRRAAAAGDPGQSHR